MKKRIFVGSMRQESNSFSPIPTTYDKFQVSRGEEILDQLPGVSVFKQAGYDIVPSICAYALPGGTVELQAYRRLVEDLLSYLPLDGSIGGVWLALHGAMDVTFIGSGEALLASMVRDRVGQAVPIAVSLDLHANNTFTLARLANILYGYRTAPHTDSAQTQVRSAELLIRALEENVMPWSEIVRLPMMLPGEAVVTTGGPGQEIIARLPEVEQAAGVWCASYFAGMPWVDCPQNGSAVVISGVGDRSEGLAAATRLGEWIWDQRDQFTFQDTALLPAEALDYAASLREGPVFVSDTADNITAGSAGDNGYMLDLVLKKGMTNLLLAGITDSAAVSTCAEAGAGGHVEFVLGGSIDLWQSTRVRMSGVVQKLRRTKDGLVSGAVVVSHEIDIIILAEREALTTEESINSFGIGVMAYKIVVVKLGYLFPDLVRIARRSILALTPGNSSQNLKELVYNKIKRPMYPMDKEASFGVVS